MGVETPEKSSWRLLLAGKNGRVSAVLAGGVAMYAITTYITGAVLPALAIDLDGERLYAWVNTGFLAASIAGSALAPMISFRLGQRNSYVAAFGLFVVGSLGIASASTIGIVLASRAIQGLGGGLLAALAYVAVTVSWSARWRARS